MFVGDGAPQKPELEPAASCLSGGATGIELVELGGEKVRDAAVELRAQVHKHVACSQLGLSCRPAP